MLKTPSTDSTGLIFFFFLFYYLFFTRGSALPLRIILETLFDLHALADKDRKNPVNGSLSEGISGFFTMKIKNIEEKSGFKVSWSVCYSFRYYL